jgi:hypothetical protein
MTTIACLQNNSNNQVPEKERAGISREQINDSFSPDGCEHPSETVSALPDSTTCASPLLPSTMTVTLTFPIKDLQNFALQCKINPSLLTIAFAYSLLQSGSNHFSSFGALNEIAEQFAPFISCKAFTFAFRAITLTPPHFYVKHNCLSFSFTIANTFTAGKITTRYDLVEALVDHILSPCFNQKLKAVILCGAVQGKEEVERTGMAYSDIVQKVILLKFHFNTSFVYNISDGKS